MFGSSNQTILQKQTLETTPKNGSLGTKPSICYMAIPVLWPEPFYRKCVGWVEEEKHQI